MKKAIVLCIIWICNISNSQIFNPENLTPSEVSRVKVWIHAFGISDTSYVKINIHRKQDEIVKTMKEYRSDSIFARKRVECCWPSNLEFFIDTLVEIKKGSNIFHGLYMQFGGDSTCYDKGYFKNGIKDSLWVYKTYQGLERVTLKNGRYEGDYLIYDQNGALIRKIKYARGTVVDTAYTWYESGAIREKEFYKKGKSIWHKCFNKEGIEMECDL